MRRPATPFDATYALPLGFTALLIVGATASGLHGRLGPLWVLALAAGVTLVIAALAEPLAAVTVALIAWMTVIGFSGPPYGTLQASNHQAVRAAVVLGVVAAAGVALGLRRRWRAHYRRVPIESTLVDMLGPHEAGVPAPGAPRRRVETGPAASLQDLATAIGARRQLAGVVLAAAGLPLLTIALAAVRSHLELVDDLLLFLVAVVGVTLVGGFWPAVVAAVAASLLLNWFFTPPIHNWTIDSPQNLLALLLFVTVAVTVSSIVHLAARRAASARQSREESGALLGLARNVLGGHDTARDVVEHLADQLDVDAELLEHVGGGWVRIAAAGAPGDDLDVATADAADARVIDIRPDLQMRVSGEFAYQVSERILEGYGAQAAAALDRERLRVQAAQAEVLAAGNRMRTALLAAVSHDLRTPLASVKASVSSLRQTDVTWSAQDHDDLLATIEENADRLDSLIANLLDMSRIQTGSLQPLLRPTSLDEVAPLALRGLDADCLVLDIPDTLPMVTTDPGLLERAIANLVANALRYSPPDRPARLTADVADGVVSLDVIDFGPGVPANMREKIFEPFQQLGDQRTGSGVGLGLAVARGFIEAMGGTITASQTSGGGLTMHLEFRVARSAADAASPS